MNSASTYSPRAPSTGRSGVPTPAQAAAAAARVKAQAAKDAAAAGRAAGAVGKTVADTLGLTGGGSGGSGGTNTKPGQYDWMGVADPFWAGDVAWVNGTTSQWQATQIKHIRDAHGQYHDYIGNDQNGYTRVADPLLERQPSGQPHARPTKASGLDPFSAPRATSSAAAIVAAFKQQALKNPQHFGEIQDLLQRAGYYGSAGTVPKSFSMTDQQALVDALQSANEVHMTLQDYLTRRAASAAAMGVGVNRRVNPTIPLTNPDEIRAQITATQISPTSGSSDGNLATKTIGRNLTDAEMQQTINDIHSGEHAAGVAADNANPKYERTNFDGSVTQTGGPQPGGDVTMAAPVNKDTLIQAFTKAHPAEAQGTAMGERGQDILRLLSGSQDIHMPTAGP